jgi:peptidoglycan/LPS O-acetylase OafA/YrhL
LSKATPERTIEQRRTGGTGQGGRYYRPELDVLRFFAFFMVFLSHVVPGDEAFFRNAHVPPKVAGFVVTVAASGAFGVDLFFVLSSFLITTLLLRERAARGSIDVASFYIRRILRIWPLYFAFLLLAPPLMRHVLPDEHLPIRYLLALVLFYGNWAYVLWGYPASVAAPLWSVSIEEQFYLCWPIIMRRWIHHLAIVAMVLLAVSSATRAWLVFHGAVHPQVWCNTLARLDPIAAGALLAIRVEHKPIALSAWARSALLFSGCALLLTVTHYGDFVGEKVLWTFPGVTLACTTLIVGTLGPRQASGRARIVRGLAYLGRISYGLYLFHWMFVEIFAVQSRQTASARSASAMAALLATVLMASASYHFFERPFLRLKERFTRVRSRPV